MVKMAHLPSPKKQEFNALAIQTQVIFWVKGGRCQEDLKSHIEE